MDTHPGEMSTRATIISLSTACIFSVLLYLRAEQITHSTDEIYYEVNLRGTMYLFQVRTLERALDDEFYPKRRLHGWARPGMAMDREDFIDLAKVSKQVPGKTPAQVTYPNPKPGAQ